MGTGDRDCSRPGSVRLSATFLVRSLPERSLFLSYKVDIMFLLSNCLSSVCYVVEEQIGKSVGGDSSLLNIDKIADLVSEMKRCKAP